MLFPGDRYGFHKRQDFSKDLILQTYFPYYYDYYQGCCEQRRGRDRICPADDRGGEGADYGDYHHRRRSHHHIIAF